LLIYFYIQIQLLHSIQGNTSGGNSIFVDAFNVANELQKNNPDAFNVLKNFHVRYVDYGTDAFGGFAYGYSRPIIKYVHRPDRMRN
jgi:hypothetical protein